MLCIDLACFSKMVIVLCEVVEDVVLAMMLVDLLHEARITRPQIDNCVPCLFNVCSCLLQDRIDELLVDSLESGQQIHCVVATHHKVLEDVVNNANLLVDHTMDERAEAACMLPSQS